MLKLNKQQISIIQTLKPIKTGYLYNPKSWNKLPDSCKQLISEFENKMITRGDVIKSYKAFYKNGDDVLKPFLLTMVWGFGKTNYGTYRTNVYLTDEHMLLVKAGIEAVKSKDLELAFHKLNEVKGLGISYISKVLYFASKGAGIKNYNLIFDRRVAGSLVKLAEPSIVNLLTIAPSDKYEDYFLYNQLMHDLANRYSVEADLIEYFLFEPEL